MPLPSGMPCPEKMEQTRLFERNTAYFIFKQMFVSINVFFQEPLHLTNGICFFHSNLHFSTGLLNLCSRNAASLKQSKTSVENQGILHYTTWILHLKENLPEIARLRYFFDITVEDHQIKWEQDIYIYIYLVGSLEHLLFFDIHIGNNHPNWLSCSSEGLKPPTRYIDVSFNIAILTWPMVIWMLNKDYFVLNGRDDWHAKND